MGDTRFECAEDDKLTAQMTRLSHVIFFFNPRPSPLVNASMRKRTIYKRIREDLLGCRLSRGRRLSSAHSIHFACLCFLFPFFSPLPLPSRMVPFCGRCREKKNKSQGLNGEKVLFLKGSAKQRGGSRCKCQ